MASTTSSSHTHIYTLWIWYNRPWDWDCLKDWMCTFLVITSSSKRLKLILKFSEIMPLYPGGAFRCGDNGLIHSISFKPVVDQPSPTSDGWTLHDAAILTLSYFYPICKSPHLQYSFLVHIHTLKMFDTIYWYLIWALLNLVLCCISRSKSYCGCLKQSSLKFATRIRCPKSWGSIVSGSGFCAFFQIDLISSCCMRILVDTHNCGASQAACKLSKE